jgi:hypothetical protein
MDAGLSEQRHMDKQASCDACAGSVRKRTHRFDRGNQAEGVKEFCLKTLVFKRS